MTSTTVDVVGQATAYSEHGPYSVGVTTLALPTGNLVEVWYPASPGSVAASDIVSYDMRDFTPPAVRDILTGDVSARYSFPGARDVPAADGPFPVVLFSHGFAGFRLQSSFLTSHLASWGFVVAAPDHPTRDLTSVLSAAASGDPRGAVTDLLGSLDLLTAAHTEPGNLLEGRIDDAGAVAVGHSAGGSTILGAAIDQRVLGYVSMASGINLGTGGAAPTTTAVSAASGTSVEPAAPTTTFAPLPGTTVDTLPGKPSLFIAGAIDGIISAETRTRPSFAAVPEPSRLWIIDGVGHNGFDDFCTFGNGTGIIGVAEASGLGAFLDSQPRLRALGEDGCLEPAVPVDVTFPIIRHAVTAWIRNTVGIDAEPVGLGPGVADEYPVPIEIIERL